jgi:alkylation response protein AidB-like acyl-CoA dehydrogenase
MSAAVGAGAELARSLDESLAKILAVEALLEVTGDDRPLGEEALGEIRELGVDLISLPEEVGGLGIDVGERLPLAAVFGRRLVPAALRDEAFGLAPALAALGLDGAGGGEVAALLERVAAGELSGAVALAAGGGGPIATVPGGAEVLALLGTEELSLYALGGESAVAVEPFEGLDSGQSLARIGLAGVEPLALVRGAAAETVRREYELMLICEAFGAGERCLEMAVEYAGERRQFGQEIAGFQAVAHLLAGAKLGIEISRAGIGRYVDLADEDDAAEAALDDHLAVLRHSLPAAAREACETSIQVHGGIGFSWELGLHLFYRRILAVQYLLGGEGTSAESVGVAYMARRER